MNQYACAITGHRPTRFCFGYNEEDPLCQKLKECLLEQFRICLLYTSLRIDLKGKKHILSAPLDHTLKDIMVLVQCQFSQHLVLEHHRLVVLVQNGLQFRAVLMGLDHLGDCLLYTSRCV